jgi:adiponectin receptor
MKSTKQLDSQPSDPLLSNANTTMYLDSSLRKPILTQSENMNSTSQLNFEEPIDSVTEKSSQSADWGPFIGDLEDAPEYMLDNKYILTGYRINFNSFRLLIRSLCMCHNESVNIWSHLLGCIAYLTLGIVFLAVLNS